MDEAQYLADRVVVIARGRVVAEGTPSTLGSRDHARARVRYRIPTGVAPPAGIGGTPGPDGFVEVAVDDAVGDVHTLLHWAIDQGVELEGLEITRPSLEDVYLSLTDSTSGDGAAAASRSSSREPS
jgi:ABC-2 type transport system ATP-binding protein